MALHPVLFLLTLWAPLSLGQIKFPGELEGEHNPREPRGPSISPAVGLTRPAASPPFTASREDFATLSSTEQIPGDDPQARFLFGGGGGLFSGGLTGLACRSCSFRDPIKADRCCKRGQIHCCSYTGFGFGSGGPFPPVGPSLFGDKSGVAGGFKPVGPPGYIPGEFGTPGLGGFGFGGQGFGGLHGPSSKPGFCPRPGLFSGLGRLFGLRDNGDHNSVLADEGKPSKHKTKRQLRFDDSAEIEKDVQVANEPEQRFLPIFDNLPNPFCRDQCYTDLDCPASLKCCIGFTNCRQCTFPRYNF